VSDPDAKGFDRSDFGDRLNELELGDPALRGEPPFEPFEREDEPDALEGDVTEVL
jgi:hypothetical protein